MDIEDVDDLLLQKFNGKGVYLFTIVCRECDGWGEWHFENPDRLPEQCSECYGVGTHDVYETCEDEETLSSVIDDWGTLNVVEIQKM